MSARGAAILAARSVAALAETPPLAQTRYQPRPQAHARYAALYPVYRLLREQMLPVWQARQAALQPLLRTYNHENRFYRRACWRP
ncbi:D-3-phosphoglycerate dehydrogenase [Klebsiella pneumoniae]|nr:D-3-phosphoglycerate dehydrogenase [Klebsiella pneumoniae]